MKLIKQKRGQSIVVGIVIVFIAAIIWASLTPVLIAFLGPVAGNASARGDATQALLIDLLPVIGWIVIILAFLGVRQIGQEAEGSQ